LVIIFVCVTLTSVFELIRCTQNKNSSNRQGNHFCIGTKLEVWGRIRLKFWKTGQRLIMMRKF